MQVNKMTKEVIDMEEKELENRLTKLEERTKNNTFEISEIRNTTKAIYQINANMEKMFEEMKDLKQDNIRSTNEIKDDVKTIKSDLSDVKKDVDSVRQEVENVKTAPQSEKAKKWDKVSWVILSGVITFILGYMLNTIIK